MWVDFSHNLNVQQNPREKESNFNFVRIYIIKALTKTNEQGKNDKMLCKCNKISN